MCLSNKYELSNEPCHSSLLSVTVCEPTAMSEAVVMESRAGGFLESSCGAGDSAASLDDGIVDAAKYVHTNTSGHLDNTVSKALVPKLGVRR